MAALAGPGAAHAADVHVVVVPAESLVDRYASRGAVGLLVPGEGDEVSGEAARAALVRGRVRNSALGGTPPGRPLIELARRQGPITIYVSLPPPGRRPNDRRYPLAVVGGGYRGVLFSPSTRLAGLVSLADVAPSALALERGERPALRWRAAADAPAQLERLERRLARADDARLPANLTFVAVVIAASVLSLLARSAWLARTAVLAAPVALAVSLACSLAGLWRPGPLTLVLALAIPLGSGALAALLRRPRALGAALVALVALYLVVLARWPEANALAAIGPQPDGGGRFFGITNKVETLLLAASLAGAMLLGLRSVLPVALLTLATIGLSRTGADGGGVLVAAASFAALAARMARVRVTVRRAALAAAAVVAAGLALIGVDALAGGSSHVTRGVGAGPAFVLRDIGHRLHLSAARVSGSVGVAIGFAWAIVGLVFLATRRQRSPALDALIVGVLVSLVVNDSPVDVAAHGALAGLALWSLARVRPARTGTR